MIRLIAIDVDGTLLDSRGMVPGANLEALEEAARRGIRLAIVTGRSFFFALPAVAPLPDPLIADRPQRRDRPRAIGRHADAPAAAVRPRARRAGRDRELAGLGGRAVRSAAGGPDGLRPPGLDASEPRRASSRRTRPSSRQVTTLEDALTEDPIQMAYNGEVAPMRALVAALATHPAASQLSISLTEYAARDFSLVDVCAAGTTKGSTLARLAAMLGIDRSEVLAVGDNYNDRDMLEWAGDRRRDGKRVGGARSAGFERHRYQRRSGSCAGDRDASPCSRAGRLNSADPGPGGEVED